MSEQGINLSKARAQLRALLEKVQRSGRPVTILRRGKPQAVLLSYEQYRRKLDIGQADSWRLEGSLRGIRGVQIGKVIRAARESVKKELEHRMADYGFDEPDT